MNKADVVLDLLASERRWWFGLELVEKSDGRLGRGTVYAILDDLEDDGWIVSRANDSNGRREYRITESGLRVRLIGDEPVGAT